jgi:hypothetical protein
MVWHTAPSTCCCLSFKYPLILVIIQILFILLTVGYSVILYIPWNVFFCLYTGIWGMQPQLTVTNLCILNLVSACNDSFTTNCNMKLCTETQKDKQFLCEFMYVLNTVLYRLYSNIIRNVHSTNIYIYMCVCVCVRVCKHKHTHMLCVLWWSASLPCLNIYY